MATMKSERVSLGRRKDGLPGKWCGKPRLGPWTDGSLGYQPDGIAEVARSMVTRALRSASMAHT